MALPYQDTFTAASNSTLQSYSANWTISAGAFSVDATNDAVYPNSAGAECGAFVNSETPSADQYAQVVLSNIVDANASVGPAVRCAAGGNYYGLYYSRSGGGMVFLFKMVGGTWTGIAESIGVGAWANGDVLRLEVSGTTLTPKRNGTLIAALGTKTDSSLSSGKVGICGYDALSTCRLDNFEGGNLGGGAVALTASNITTGAATVGAATIGQVHALAAAGIATGAPTLGAPSMSGSAALTATGITTGAPAAGAASLGQKHALAATGIATGAPALGTPGVLPLLAATVGGVLTVDPTNGRYFRNGSGIVLLAGFHTWYEFQDGGLTYPPGAFDYVAWLDYLDARGVNFHKMWVLETARGWSDADAYFDPLPWARTGPGNAADGRPKFDLTQFNQAYFDRLRERVILAGNRGHYVAAQLFQGWNITAKGMGNYPFIYHPLNGPNNINGIDGDADNDNEGEETRNLANTAIIAIQAAYVEKVVDTLNDLDNVLWEISNEEDGTTQTNAWQNHWIAHIHDYEAGKPKQHPVGFTVAFPNGDDAVLTSSDAEWISPKNGSSLTPGTAGGAQVILFDTDHIVGLTTEHEWVWQSFTRGYNPVYMDVYDGALYGADMRADAAHERIRRNLGWVLDYAARLNLQAATPQNSLSSTGYCLAGSTQLVAYQHTSGAFTVNLASYSGVYSVEWLRTAATTPTTQAGSNVNGGATRTLTPPWSGEDVVAYLERVGADLTATGITAGAASVGAPAIGQTHALAANAIAAGAASAGAAALGQTHALSATGIVTGAPVTGTPSLAHVYALAAVGIVTGAPVVDAAGIAQVHALTATALATEAAVLGAPQLAHVHVLAAAALTTGAAALGAPAIGQVHALAAAGLTTGAPDVGAPSMTGEIALVAAGIVAGAPGLGAPALAQVHALAAVGVVTGAFVLGAPSMAGEAALAANGITTGAPTVDAASVGQVHALGAVSIAAGAAVSGAAGLGQVHVLAALWLATGAASVGNPALNYSDVETPASRTLRVEFVDRVYVVEAVERIFRIE